jgi:hypothetical protein
MKHNLSIGDKVVSDIFKLEKGLPSIMKIKKIDDDFGLVFFDHKGQEHFMGLEYLRPATKFEKIFGPIYDFFIK